MEINQFIQKFELQLEDSHKTEITGETILESINGWDSMTILMVIGMVKTDYNKSVTTNEIKKCLKVLDLYNLVMNKNE